MIDSATVSTITIAVAADNPPMKAISAKNRLPAASGRASTKVSASTPLCPRTAMPATAIGMTKTLMAMR